MGKCLYHLLTFLISLLFRKMMDSGQLDFYQHSTLCTNTCRSTKFDLLINNTRFPPDGSALTTPTSSQGEREKKINHIDFMFIL